MKKTTTIALLALSLLTGGIFFIEIAQATITYQAFYELEDLTDSENGFDLEDYNSNASFVAGKYNNGFQSVSTPNSILRILNNLGVGETNNSMGGWFKITTQPTANKHGFLLSRGNATTHVRNTIDYFDDNGTKKINFVRTRHSIGDAVLTYTITLTTGIWYHIAITYDSANLIAYINGIPVDDISSLGNGTDLGEDHFTIGALGPPSYSDPLYFADAVADDVFVSNQCFTQGEIQTISEGLVAPPSIEISYPANATSTAGDFASWKLTGNIATPAHNWFKVIYGNSSSSVASGVGSWPAVAQDYVGFDIGFGSFNLFIPKTRILATSTDYYARALFENDYGYNVATSTQITFTIGGGPPVQNGGNIPYQGIIPTSTASSTDWNFTCDPNSNFFTNSFCNLLLYLFLPKQTDLTQFSNLMTGISDKAPFGYFTLIKNALTNVSSTTSTVQLALISNFTGPIWTGFSWFLWFLFSIWLFNRIRKLDL